MFYYSWKKRVLLCARQHIEETCTGEKSLSGQQSTEIFFLVKRETSDNSILFMGIILLGVFSQNSSDKKSVQNKKKDQNS
jgi:hypothetical protein